MVSIPAQLPNDELRSWADSIIEMASSQRQPEELASGTRYVLATPKGEIELLDFTEPRHLFRDGHDPIFPSGSFAFEEAPGFIDYIKHHGLPNRTEIWNHVHDSVKSIQFIAVLDGHVRVNRYREDIPEAQAQAQEAKAGWGVHRAVLTLKRTKEWEQWLGYDRTTLDQATFAEFIDENLQDIQDPNGATLLEMASKLSVTTGVSFTSCINLSSGENKLIYAEEHKKGDILLPAKFTLGVSPFEGMPAYKVTARLRYKVHNQKATFKYLLNDPKDIERHAMQQLANTIQGETGIMVYKGYPCTPLV